MLLGVLVFAVSLAFLILGSDSPPDPSLTRELLSVCGAVTIAAVYRMSQRFFKSPFSAVQSALIAAWTQLPLLLPRLGARDALATMFFSLGLAVFAGVWMARGGPADYPKRTALAAFWFGLALAAQPSIGFVPLVVCLVLAWPGFQKGDYPHGRFRSVIYALGAALLAYDLAGLADHHLRITWPMVSLSPLHSSLSPWWSWLGSLKPAWLLDEVERSSGISFHRVVLAQGNPLVLGAGLLALLVCLKDAVLERDAVSSLIASFYFPMVGFWILRSPMGPNFTYMPAALLLGPALAAALISVRLPLVLVFHAACVAFLLNYYPLLTAERLSESELHEKNWIERFSPVHPPS